MHTTTMQPAGFGVPASVVLMGSTQLAKRHFIKGGLFLLVQLLFLFFASDIASALKGLVTLGEVTQHRSGFTIIHGDHSIHMLVEGVIALFISLAFLFTYVKNVQDARRVTACHAGFREQLKALYDDHFPIIMLSPAGLAAIAFIILPIVITVLVSLTNYAAPGNIPPRNLVDWVGFQNFRALFELKIWSSTLLGVGSWTFVWATSATMFTCGFGFILALALSNRDVVGQKIWRVIFMLPYAIPAFVTLLVFRLLLNGVGPVNALLNSWGFDSIAFLSDPTLAKMTVIGVGVWVGAPYFMLLISGALTNIPKELYEASEVDGASRFQQFREITLPMVLHQVAPSLVMTFTFNFNNFGAVFLLTEGGPINPEYRFAGHTDILITWIYKLTLEFQQYNIASVVSIIIFLFLSLIAIWQFSRMKSFKNDVGM
ncbi:sugar ABC transporter permease [Endozoicomonas gorgoniicola]|uniref:Maltose/maltodextrin transport system permease protein n=1 Tax=Endozoicomonas gorgoniicola TaxID=1234144 RepID=A0ABT3N1V4_9GAMM|nr:sugar ABC transporter permease [Endozoicomonas gorgoniicola]MCW7555611.1 sugar ABC transporter permease [Endozoicomonas gorgoniicola]